LCTIDLSCRLALHSFTFYFYSCSNLKTLKILRIVRILRLLKMVRMLRITRLLKKWECAIEVDYRQLSLVKLGLMFGIVAHWMACFWQITTVLEDAINESNMDWTTAYQHLQGSAPWQLYITSLYWAIITMSTIGFGGTTPVNQVAAVCSSQISVKCGT
jgi:hyperpolarization activated cyclic nucleotide-gated potassium channel 2